MKIEFESLSEIRFFVLNSNINALYPLDYYWRSNTIDMEIRNYADRPKKEVPWKIDRLMISSGIRNEEYETIYTSHPIELSWLAYTLFFNYEEMGLAVKWVDLFYEACEEFFNITKRPYEGKELVLYIIDYLEKNPATYEKSVGEKLMEWELDHDLNKEAYERGKQRAKKILEKEQEERNKKNKQEEK